MGSVLPRPKPRPKKLSQLDVWVKGEWIKKDKTYKKVESYLKNELVLCKKQNYNQQEIAKLFELGVETWGKLCTKYILNAPYWR